MKTFALWSRGWKPRLPVVLLAILGFCATSARAQTTISPTNRWAWSGNTGWIDFRGERPATNDGVRVFDAWLGGYAWSPNVGWINFGDGFAQSGIKYSNANNFDFGVNHDGAGNLSGLAWAPNAGWINFGWTTNGNPDAPRIDLTTGSFTGLAWGANIGWINLANGPLRTESIAVFSGDGDTISDPWEYFYVGANGIMDNTTDTDGDGILDWQEYVADTNPTNFGGGVVMTRIETLPDPTVGIFSWASSPTRVYDVQYSTNLVTGPWVSGGIYPGSSSNTTTLAYAAFLSNLHFRAWAKLPLTP